MALSSPESPVPPRRVVINRTENPSEEHEELNKMAHCVVAESRSEDVFSSYACNSLNHKGIKHHLGDIVEAGCLAVSMYTAYFLKYMYQISKYQLFKSLPQDLVETDVFKLYMCKRENCFVHLHMAKSLCNNSQQHATTLQQHATGCANGRNIPYRGVCMEDFDHILGDNFVIILIKGNVDKPIFFLFTSGKLSDLQLEGVLYACQRHQMVLANGQRAGFFIGDGAGVGKGRQIAGIVLDNFARGRSRHTWFSISADLRLDAQRDLHDIGCFVKVIDGCQQLDKETRVFGLPADFKEGVVFSTYATLVSSVQKGANRQSRLQQLIDWCGGEQFNGCLIFDECHKAKHFVPGKEESSTKVALAVTTIQRMLPKARVVYCSTTGVTDVKNMAFMERLGLWGDGTAFKSFDSFLASITKRGLGASEMLAMEMKASGMYVSRGLSFRQAEFVNVEATLTAEQRKVYDTAVHVW
ncbi:unnamed protein product, partial [Porites lobata]